MCTGDAVLLEPTTRDVPYPLVLASQPASARTNARYFMFRFCIIWDSMHVLVAMVLPDHAAKHSAACTCQDVPLAP